MDLELTDEQIWIRESVDTLLRRAGLGGASAADAEPAERRRVWDELVSFGALGIGGPEGLGAVELCLIAVSLGAHLASVPFLGSAAVRYALAPFVDSLSPENAELAAGPNAISIALLEPGSGWQAGHPSAILTRTGGGLELHGKKVAVEHLELADRLAVIAARDGEPALALIDARGPRSTHEARPSFDESVPMGATRFSGSPVLQSQTVGGPTARVVLARLMTIGSLLAAAEAVGAAGEILEHSRTYAGERRQFGQSIAGFQSLRHILADMHVRVASGWSTVLYAAAALDDDAADAETTASVAKAYVSRSAREVAHGAMQVFGGISFTAEHPAHRFLRRIVVREQQFGDAAHHERLLGRALARRAAGAPPSLLNAEPAAA
jgi:alkylation response protein AidB-like acyl-CoA dehydrogenase